MNQRTDEDKVRLIEKAIENFRGNSKELEAAIGFYFIGIHMGWKFLHLSHSRPTVNKYEKILDVRIREEFDEETEFTQRSVGWKIWLSVKSTVKDFWAAARGQVEGARSPDIEAI